MGLNTFIEDASIKTQDDFLGLPKDIQDLKVDTQHAAANIMNRPRSIEIAGYKILTMPLESMNLTLEQQKEFEEAGGLINPTYEVATAVENQDKMMHWIRSFDDNCFHEIGYHNGYLVEFYKKKNISLSYFPRSIPGETTYSYAEAIDQLTLEEAASVGLYKGFEFFKKIYEGFSDIASLTLEEATEAGLYPNFHVRNEAAKKWIAEKQGGHLAVLDSTAVDTDSKEKITGELRDIVDHVINSTLGKKYIEKFASIGQAPFGLFDFNKSGCLENFGIGECYYLASPSGLESNYCLSIEIYYRDGEGGDGITQLKDYTALDLMSSVVVLDK